MANRVPIQEGLFTWPSDEPSLLGSRCRGCGEVSFPVQESCPACAGGETDVIPLAREGTLWTWTIQRFPPPTPPFVGASEGFEPFGVGYVELAEGVRVESRLTVNDPAQLRIGMKMELVVEPYDRDADGNERMIFAFRPAA